MKVSTKLIVLVSAAILLFISSFVVDSFFNRTIQSQYGIRSSIQDFEISLLQTIVREKEYNRFPDADAAALVLAGVQESLVLLKAVLTDCTDEQNNGLERLSTGLQEYRTTFDVLSGHNEQLHSLVQQLDTLYAVFLHQSMEAVKTVDRYIGMAYIEGTEIDSTFHSMKVLNESILAAVMEIVLTVKNDLTLSNEKELENSKHESLFMLLHLKDKKLRGLGSFINDESLEKYIGEVHGVLPRLNELAEDISRIREENSVIIDQLNESRSSILQSTSSVSRTSDAVLSTIQTRVLWLKLYSFLFALVILISFGVYTSASIVKPVRATVERLRDIVEGEGDLTARLKVQGRDEMSELARWFNRFVESQQLLFADIRENIEILHEAADGVRNVSERLASGTTEMSGQAENAAGAAERMSNNITSMASAVEDMSQSSHSVSSTAEQLSMNMNMVAESIEETSMSMTEVAKTAQGGSELAKKAAAMSSAASDTMSLLGNAALEIGQVTTLIQRIAGQTNLLALNATIEAASAGDAGSGFAVVASEIKELAGQSSSAAEDIGERIRGVQVNTEEAIQGIADVAATIEALNESSTHITRSVEEQTVIANEISGNIQQANVGVNDIASSIAQIASVAEEMAANAGTAASEVNGVSLNTKGVSRAAADSNEDSRQVKASAEKLADVASVLHDLVSKFKIVSE